jgi:hypothetical protein
MRGYAHAQCILDALQAIFDVVDEIDENDMSLMAMQWLSVITHKMFL